MVEGTHLVLASHTEKGQLESLPSIYLFDTQILEAEPTITLVASCPYCSKCWMRSLSSTTMQSSMWFPCGHLGLILGEQNKDLWIQWFSHICLMRTGHSRASPWIRVPDTISKTKVESESPTTYEVRSSLLAGECLLPHLSRNMQCTTACSHYGSGNICNLCSKPRDSEVFGPTRNDF